MANDSRRSVIVVEDDQIDAEYIVKSLRKFEVSIEVMVRAYEAISRLRAKDAPRPALILLDWKISGGGASVLRAVREDPVLGTVPVVILSRSTAHADVRAAYVGHANAFVAKASELHEFQDQVKTICEFFLNTAQSPPALELD